MQTVNASINLSFALVAALIAVVTTVGTARFISPSPTADLEPVGGAETVVELLQGSETLLWKALSGSVTSYVVIGWPSQSGEAELGGALMMERPEDGAAGVIDFGEKPKSLTFELDG